jgi:hypothetical protein
MPTNAKQISESAVTYGWILAYYFVVRASEIFRPWSS